MHYLNIPIVIALVCVGIALGRLFRARRGEPGRREFGWIASGAFAITLISSLLRGHPFGAFIAWRLTALLIGIVIGSRAISRGKLRALIGSLRPHALNYLASVIALLLIAALLGGAELLARHFVPLDSPMGKERLRLLSWDYGRCYQKTIDHLGRERISREDLYSRWLVSMRELPSITKPSGTYRIAVIGESSAGLMEGALDRLIENGACAAPVTVYSCSTPGGSLEMVERRFGEILEYSPDVIVLVFGHNLFTTVPSQLELASARLAAKSRLLWWLARRRGTQSLGPSIDVEGRYQAFERALRRFGAEARAHGASLVVTTMTPNLRFAPAPIPDEDKDPRWLESRLARDENRLMDAAAALRGIEAHAASSNVAFALGEVLERMGDTVGARLHLEEAVDRETSRMRVTSRTNRIIRDMARSEGIVLRDSFEAMSAIAPGGIPGWETLEDHCHLREQYIYDEARAILRMFPWSASCATESSSFHATRIGISALEERSRTLQTIARQLAGHFGSKEMDLWSAQLPRAVDETARTLGDRAEPLVADMIREQLSHAEPAAQVGALLGISEGFERAGGGTAAARYEDMALRMASGPVAASAWIRKGERALRARRAGDARNSFARAAEISPGREDVAFFLSRVNVQ